MLAPFILAPAGVFGGPQALPCGRSTHAQQYVFEIQFPLAILEDFFFFLIRCLFPDLSGQAC